jgi:putative DNA methylase
MVDDPSSRPDLFPTEKKQEKERQRLFRIIEDLVLWENTTSQTVLQAARDEILDSDALGRAVLLLRAFDLGLAVT